MESLRDISNQQTAAAPATLKTFERRRKAPGSEDTPDTPARALDCGTPLSEAPSTCSSSASCSTAQDGVPPWLSARSSVLHKGRRSSILHAAAVPGHEKSREAPASRSLLLHKMSKAKRKAYMAYTKQMAEYFAEVDEFELLEESPRAATARRTMPRVASQPAEGSDELPFAHQATPASAISQHHRSSSTPGALHHVIRTPQSLQPNSQQSSFAALATPLTQQQSGSTAEEAAHNSHTSKHAIDALDSASNKQERQAYDTTSDGTGTAVHLQLAQTTLLAAATATCQQKHEQHASCQQVDPMSGWKQHEQQQVEETYTPLAEHSLASCTPACTAATLSTASVPQQAADDCVSSRADRPTYSSTVSVQIPTATVCSPSLSATALSKQMQQLFVQEEQSQQDSVHSSEDPEQAQPTDLISATPASDHKQRLGTDGSHQQQVHAQRRQQQADTLSACPDRQQLHVLEQDLQHHQQEELVHHQSQQGQELEMLQLEQQLQQCELQQQQEAAVQLEQLNNQQPDVQRPDDAQVEQLLQRAVAEAAAQQLAELQQAAVAAAQLTPLQRMLVACAQPADLDDIPSMKDFITDVTDIREIIKLGEGTYGEAFKAPSSGVVFKLVPMEGDNLINGYEQKKAGDLLAEAIIASTLTALSEECDHTGQPYPSCTTAFVKTHKVGVCRGPYPQPFVKAWKAWDKRNKSENDPIAKHPKDQLYAVFAMADCGRDLEGYQLRGFDQARSMMLQVALALAIAEDCLAFEHRDLHWGNVMLTPATTTYIASRFRGSSVKVRTEGVAISLIDFTASRLQIPAGDVAFCDLEAEDGIFDGPKGKPQFETYRRMRKVTGGDWSGSYPGTNVMWMLYLAELLLSTDKPIPGATAGQKRQLREFKKRVTNYSCCGEVIWDELFQGLWSVV